MEFISTRRTEEVAWSETSAVCSEESDAPLGNRASNSVATRVMQNLDAKLIRRELEFILKA